MQVGKSSWQPGRRANHMRRSAHLLRPSRSTDFDVSICFGPGFMLHSTVTEYHVHVSIRASQAAACPALLARPQWYFQARDSPPWSSLWTTLRTVDAVLPRALGYTVAGIQWRRAPDASELLHISVAVPAPDFAIESPTRLLAEALPAGREKDEVRPKPASQSSPRMGIRVRRLQESQEAHQEREQGRRRRRRRGSGR